MLSESGFKFFILLLVILCATCNATEYIEVMK